MSAHVAEDGKLATYSHRCRACASAWVSTTERERRCLFCGGTNVVAAGLGSHPELQRGHIVRTDAPPTEPMRPRQHDATRPEVRRGSRRVNR